MFASTAWAQTQAPTPGGTGPADPSASSGSMAVAGFIVVLLLLLAVGIAVKLYDRKRKRDAAAVHLQAQVSDALMREPDMVGLVLTPTAHVPFRHGPAVVEISGEVPSPSVRDAVLRVAQAEAHRVQSDVEVQDRMTVRSPVAA